MIFADPDPYSFEVLDPDDPFLNRSAARSLEIS
jgi:hypothetical protein